MRTLSIKKVASRISKRYGVENYLHVEKIAKNKVEIRSELTLDEGGLELSSDIQKLDSDYICEPQGGCVYIVYKCE